MRVGSIVTRYCCLFNSNFNIWVLLTRRAMFVCCEVTVTDAYLIQRRMSRLGEYFIVLSKLLEQRGGLPQLKMRRDGRENG